MRDIDSEMTLQDRLNLLMPGATDRSNIMLRHEDGCRDLLCVSFQGGGGPLDSPRPPPPSTLRQLKSRPFGILAPQTFSSAPLAHIQKDAL